MRLAIAPAVWLAHFTAVYVLVSLVCSAEAADRELFGIAIVPLGVALATAAACALFAAVGFADYRTWRALKSGPRAFVSLVSVLLCGLSALAALWVAYPAFALPPCAA